MASPTAAPGSSSNGSTPQGSSQTSVRRARSVGTKLSDEEYAQLESLAATQDVTPPTSGFAEERTDGEDKA
jgi:hypothetical protein